MRRRPAAALAALVVMLSLLLSACKQSTPRFEYQFADAFDTFFIINAFAETQVDFDAFAYGYRDRTQELHEMFDVYNNYEGLNNIKTVNDNAGIAPVEVPPEVFDLLRKSKELYDTSQGLTNVMLGPVLKHWHDARVAGNLDPGRATVPDHTMLQELLPLCEIDKLVLDETKRTVYLTEVGCRLDVGSVAKGYAAQLAARELSAKTGVTSYLVSAGGNIVAGEAPLDGRPNWGVGLQNPEVSFFAEGNQNADVIFTKNMSVVTSGDYQRYYLYEGKRLNHIIDPRTLWPASRFRSVTVMGEESYICDALSTALFILPQEEGERLITDYGYNAVWMDMDGNITATRGVLPLMKELGGAENQ